jgi:hypothetical protein
MKSSDDCAEYFWRQKSQNFEFSFEGGGRFGQGCDLARALHSKESRIEGGPKNVSLEQNIRSLILFFRWFVF